MSEATVPSMREERNTTPREQTREEERFLTPPVDIYETENALHVIADLPGVGKDKVTIRVENNVLSLNARSDYEPRKDYLYREFGLRNYFREFKLTEAVDQSKIEANLKNGVLNLVLPKAEKAKPKRIEVKVE